MRQLQLQVAEVLLEEVEVAEVLGEVLLEAIPVVVVVALEVIVAEMRYSHLMIKRKR